MPFANTELVERIERAECRLLRDGAASVGRRVGEGVYVQELAGGLAIYTVPDSPLNKLAGLGFQGVPGSGELAEIERAFAERGATLQAEVATLADPAIAELLSRRGYVLSGFENVLGCDLPRTADPAVNEAVRVAVEARDVETWLEVVVDGFAAPDSQGNPSHESFPRETLAAIMRDMATAKDFTCYLAWLGEEPVGAASMRRSGGIAQLTGAATLPTHRRRGVQTAMLERRLADAADAGCDVACVTTLPGSKSQENVQRRGFELLYTRAILVLAPAESAG